MTRTIFVVAVLSVLFAPCPSAEGQRPPKFSAWGNVEHLPPPVNSEYDDQAPILSRDEKTLFFTSNRPGGSGGEDIWIATRKNKNARWSEPVNLGPNVNSSGIDRLRSITADGRVMLFMSNRKGSEGMTDIWASVRKHPNDDMTWSEPVNLGSTINSSSSEFAAKYLFAEGGRFQSLFFTSDRAGGFGGSDLYESNIDGLGFHNAVNVFELNTASVEMCLWLREDGLEIFFISNRPDVTWDLSKNDIWTATRESVYQSWSEPRKLGADVNAIGYQDVNPSLSSDGRTLMFASRRPGGIGPGTFDIYLATRSRLSN